MIIVKASAQQYLGILLNILGCYKTYKKSVKTSEKNGENSK